jgi:hypothetical protein
MTRFGCLTCKCAYFEFKNVNYPLDILIDIFKMISAIYIHNSRLALFLIFEPCHDKTNIAGLRSLIRIQTLLQVEKLIANSMDPDQIARMRRLVWIYAGRKPIMLVLSWRGSF